MDNVIIIDNGSDSCKVGMAPIGNRCQSVLSTVTRNRETGDVIAVGTDMLNNSPDVTGRKRYPIEHGIVTNWDDMEKLWYFIFHNKLGVDSCEFPVLLTELPCSPRCNREKTTQIMFETFNTPAMYLENQAVLSLYSSGHTTGIVMSSGSSMTFFVPVYEGHALPYATMALHIGGSELTYALSQFLGDKLALFTPSIQRNIVRDIKEKRCYVAFDYDQEKTSFDSSNLRNAYTLPDGESLILDKEQFQCPEGLFLPSLIHQERPGIHEFVHFSVNKCNESIRHSLLSNIFLSGGNSSFPGLCERMQKEIHILRPNERNLVKVVPATEPLYSSWTGGSIMAALPTFPSMCITKDEYDEYGPSFVHRKCF